MFRASLPQALALTLLAAGITVAAAQQTQPAPDANPPMQAAPPPYHHAPDPQHQAAMLTKRLNLTPDQSAKIEPILASRDQQIQAVRTNQQLSPEDRHQQLRSINQQAEQQMSTILTPDQMTQMKEMRHHHGHHGPEEAPADSGQSPS